MSLPILPPRQGGTGLTSLSALPISTAQQTALDLKADKSQLATPSVQRFSVADGNLTAGQTTISVGAYTPGTVMVFINGNKLPTNTYTATNGTAVVLADPVQAPDVVEVFSWLMSGVQNAAPISHQHSTADLTGPALSQALGGSGATSFGAATFTATGETAARTIADRAADVANLLGYWQNGDADWSNALTRAIATGKPIEIPYNGGTPYNISQTYTLPAGAVIRGKGMRPTIILNGTSSRLFTVASVSGVVIEDLIIDGSKAALSSNRIIHLDNATECHVRRVRLVTPKQGFGLYNGSSHCSIVDWECFDSGQHGVVVDGAATTGNRVTGGYVMRSVGFGIILTNGANRNEISGNRTYQNGIELVGVTFDCWENRVENNHAEGTGDNGISITGYQNTVVGNTCRKCYHSGIHVYGHHNTVTGNTCISNGQRYLADGSNFAGISIVPAFGGSGMYNTVVGNTSLDDQATPTQAYGVLLGQGSYYAVWTPSTSISPSAPYVYYGANVYKATAAGTTGTTPPTHTAGAVSDGGVTWTYIYSVTGNLHAAENIVDANTTTGNRIANYLDNSTNRNSMSGLGFVTPGNGSLLTSTASNPNGNLVGRIGDVALMSGSPTGVPYYKASGSGTTSGWNPLGGALHGTTASRPLASDAPFTLYRNDDTGHLQWSDGVEWTDAATGAPSPDTIALDYNFTTAVYRESGASVPLSTHYGFFRTGIASLRSAYPSTAITDFAQNVSRLDGRGLSIGSGLLINYFLNSATPATQSISLAAGTYALDIVGSGSATLSGGPTGTATDQNPVAFTLGSPTSVTVTISGSPVHVNLLNVPTGFVTSGVLSSDPIKTTSASFQRGYEQAYIDITSLGLTSGTIIIIAHTPSFVRGTGTYATLADATSGLANGIQIRYNSTGVNFIAANMVSGVAQTGFPTVTPPPVSSDFCVAVSFNGTDTYLALNGGSAVHGTQSAGTGGALRRLWLGSLDGSNNSCEGIIKRVILMSQVVSPSKLQSFSQASTWASI